MSHNYQTTNHIIIQANASWNFTYSLMIIYLKLTPFHTDCWWCSKTDNTYGWKVCSCISVCCMMFLAFFFFFIQVCFAVSSLLYVECYVIIIALCFHTLIKHVHLSVACLAWNLETSISDVKSARAGARMSRVACFDYTIVWHVAYNPKTENSSEFFSFSVHRVSAVTMMLGRLFC